MQSRRWRTVVMEWVTAEMKMRDTEKELNCIADSIATFGMPIEENFHVSVIVSKLPLSWKDLSIKLMRGEHLPFWKLMELITKEEESRNGVKQMGEPLSDRARFYRASEGGSSGADIKPPPHQVFKGSMNLIAYHVIFVARRDIFLKIVGDGCN
ncbi:uncharacterized protein LOC123884742 isoform X2 [Trifolium pratense]|uniref:uncharacterized protein LOC123884742 isoform X2 n=1 Tax=Trifolium pratense TaxID=57577 RepID=UPI001E694222|nr:uncharacterized protein LOC123884742 isoform X2 [Trifolium pratense]